MACLRPLNGRATLMFNYHDIEITRELYALYGKDRLAALEKVKALFPSGEMYNWELAYGIYGFVCWRDVAHGKYYARLTVGSSCD